MNVQGCYALADKVIKTKENQKVVIAKEYNQIIKNQMAKHDLTLKNIAGQFMAQSEMLKNYFPGTKYDLPGGDKSFLVEIPKEALDSKLGVPLVDAEGSITQITEKLKAIKLAAEQQNQEIDKKIETRISELETAYQEEATYWAGLASTCGSLNVAYKENQAKMKAEQDKLAAEEQKNLNELCYKSQALSITPGCDSEAEDLSDAAQKVSNRITASELKKLSTLRGYCRNSSEEEEEESEVTKSTVKSFCDTNSSSECKALLKDYDSNLKSGGTPTSKCPGTPSASTPPTYSVSSEQALDCLNGEIYLKAYEVYTKKNSSGSKDTNVTSIGQISFSACNAVNGDGNKSNAVENFLKEFGDGAKSVQN